MNKITKILASTTLLASLAFVPTGHATMLGPCDYILNQNCGGPNAQSCQTRSKNYSACKKRNAPKNPNLGQQKTRKKAINNSGRSGGK